MDITHAASKIYCEDNIIHQDMVQAARVDLVDGTTASNLAQTFQSLADPTRVRLISALYNTELCVCDLAAILGMTQSAVSHQLRTLRDLRIVKARRTGREIFYSMDDDHVRQLFQLGLNHVHHR